MKLGLLFPCCVTLTAVMSAVAHADLTWTETTSMGGAKGAGFAITTTSVATKEGKRTETIMKMGPMTMDNVDVDRCLENKHYVLAPALKLYAESGQAGAMSGMPNMGGRPGGMPGMAPPSAGPPQTGTDTIDAEVTDLGTEKVAGFDTEHYQVTMTTTTTGCSGNATEKVQMETWVADIPMPAPCMTPDAEHFLKGNLHSAQASSACDSKMTFTGNVGAMRKAFGGFIMRMKMEIGDKGSFTKEVTMISQAEVTTDPTAIPADWQEVSVQALDQAKQRAMMQAMMGSMGGAGGLGGLGGFHMPPMPGMAPAGGPPEGQ